MIRSFDDLDLSNRQKLELRKPNDQSSWTGYRHQYSRVVDLLVELGTKGNYAINPKAKPILYLVMHRLELNLKEQLNDRKLPVPHTHELLKLSEMFGESDPIYGLGKVLATTMKDTDGSQFKYAVDPSTGRPFFTSLDKFYLAKFLGDFNQLSAATKGELIAILPFFDYEDRILSWDFTFHLGESTKDAIIKTQYDEVIHFLITKVLDGSVGIEDIYLPLLFLIRHAMELGLKSNLQELMEKGLVVIKGGIEREHSLQRLANLYNVFLDSLNVDSLPADLATELQDYKRKFSELYSKVHTLDFNSMAFRYPCDKDGEPYDFRPKIASLLEILESYYFIAPFIKYTNSVLQDHSIIDLSNPEDY